MKVWVLQDTWRELGETRYEIEWITVNPSAMGKDDIDPDMDVIWNVDYRADKESAMKLGEAIYDRESEAGTLYWGAVTVTKQVVEWLVEEDGVAEWINTSDQEEIG